MDNLGNSNVPDNDDIDKPIPFDDSPGVSRSPLNLGGSGGSAPAPKPPARTPSPQPAAKKSVAPTVSGAGDRIMACKIFFAKLHAGALDFLSDQICSWLQENPDIQIKHTNVAVGDVQSKKTEPNILVTVWY
jgi:hypothetical protein